jgi:dTDP-4-dehydrorhamnose 3,5-epimerase
MQPDRSGGGSEEGAAMKVMETPLRGLLVLEPKVFGDDRGFFLESYNERVMAEIGIADKFVQDNHSYSVQNVVRGLHYQVRHPQGKLVRAVAGEIFDVAVDLRKASPTCGRWYGVNLSEQNRRILWVPSGFAHGFGVASDGAHVLYKATDFYRPELERTLLWNDLELDIDWKLKGEPILSAKDMLGRTLRDAEKFD